MANPNNALIEIRAIRLDDCTEEYVSWLNDPLVNQYLETRHERQSLQKIREYVRSMIRSDNQHLFAITADAKHVGNIKLGPVNVHHSYSDIAYFIGDKRCWNKGYATQAIGLILNYAFVELGLHCITAGFYNSNAGSRSALIKNGFAQDGCIHNQLKNNAGMFEDHVIFALLSDDWKKLTAKK